MHPVAISYLTAPKAKRLALGTTDALGRQEISVYDSERGTLSLLTPTHAARRPLWTPDGERMTFSRTTGPTFCWMRADGELYYHTAFGQTLLWMAVPIENRGDDLIGRAPAAAPSSCLWSRLRWLHRRRSLSRDQSRGR